MMRAYKKYTLSNGLKLIVSPMKNTRIVSVNVFVRGGSRCETVSNNGITHFIEHMLFKGTDKRKDAFSISKEVDAVSGDLNGATGQEYCYFYMKILDNHFEKSLDILSDMLLNSRFDKNDMELERRAILEEIKMRKDIPSSYVWEVFNDLLYGGQPLGFPISGKEKVINGFSRKRLTNYWKQMFVTDNIVISIAGDVGAAEAARLVEKYFGSTGKGKVVGYLPVREKQKKPAVALYYKKTEQTHLCLGNRTFNYLHPDFYVMQVINGILGINMSSRLFTRLREQEGLVYSISSGNDFFNDAGCFSVHAGAGHANVMRTIRIILEELGRLKSEKVDVEELKRVKNCMAGYMLMVLDNSTGVSNYTGRQELRLGKIVNPEDRIRMIKKVTAEDVKRVMEAVYTKESFNLALIGPFRDKSKFMKLLESQV